MNTVQLARATLESLARKIYQFETPVQVGVDYSDDGLIRTPDFIFTSSQAEKLLALQQQYQQGGNKG